MCIEQEKGGKKPGVIVAPSSVGVEVEAVTTVHGVQQAEGPEAEAAGIPGIRMSMVEDNSEEFMLDERGIPRGGRGRFSAVEKGKRDAADEEERDADEGRDAGEQGRDSDEETQRDSDEETQFLLVEEAGDPASARSRSQKRFRSRSQKKFRKAARSRNASSMGAGGKGNLKKTAKGNNGSRNVSNNNNRNINAEKLWTLEWENLTFTVTNDKSSKDNDDNSKKKNTKNRSNSNKNRSNSNKKNYDIFRKVSTSSSESDDSRRERNIIEGVYGRLYPGEITALIGPSGAGKSTLTNLLAARQSWSKGLFKQTSKGYLSSGIVKYGGKQVSFEDLRDSVSYVMQEDHLFPTQTVLEALTFAARLQLPEIVSEKQIKRNVNELLETLDLTDCKDVLVGGDGLIKGISGGQRKRYILYLKLIQIYMQFFKNLYLKNLL